MANPIAYEAITVSTTAIGPTVATVTPRVRCAFFYVKGAAVRYRPDGTAPTASAGLPIEDGGHIIVSGEANVRNTLFIRRDAVDATVHAMYWDEPLDFRGFGPTSVEGTVAHDAVDSGNPSKIGGKASNTAPTAVAAADRVEANFTTRGSLAVHIGDSDTANKTAVTTHASDAMSQNEYGLNVSARLVGLAPDAALDRLRTARDSAPGLGALNVAPIGGDVTIRASAVIGEASGTSTALADVGWVRAMLVFLDVTVVPTGGAPTLDVYLQTQLASGDWQDIAHFAQVAGSVTSQLLSWGPAEGDVNGTQGEGAAPTVDNFFAEQDAALAASTIRLMPLGDSLRIKWVFAAGASTGDYTFSCVATLHTK